MKEKKPGSELRPQGEGALETRRIGRRKAVKLGLGAAAGVVLGATYVGPVVASTKVNSVSAVSGPIDPWGNGKDKKDKKDKKEK